jgi:ApaG protein
MYTEETDQIEVQVQPHYVPEHSKPQQGLHVFAYRVKITNKGTHPKQLLSRHWIITDGNGKVQEVRGPGVVGEQPVLRTGESYEYESFCPLPTPTGNMRGNYLMVDDTGVESKIRIPLFFLRDLRNLH